MKYGKITLVIMVLALIIATVPAAFANIGIAGGPTPIAWRVQLALSNGQSAYWGASDSSYGFASNISSPTSGDVAIGQQAEFESLIEQGMYTPHSTTAWVWCPDVYGTYPDPLTLEITMQWYDAIYMKWMDGPVTNNRIDIQVISPWGEQVADLNMSALERASLKVHSDSQEYDKGFRLDMASTSSVPEPASLLALGTGLIGAIGFGLKRRR